MTLDRFREREGLDTPTKRFEAAYVAAEFHGEKIVLLKPQTYMNLSGRSVRDAVSYLARSLLDRDGDEPPDLTGEVLVVFDDLDLPFGKLRFRASGSSGGHRGAASVIEALGTDRFSRLRIGIGRTPGAEAARYVLEPLSGGEKRRLAVAADHAAATLPVWITEGVERCASRFNGEEGELRWEERPE